MYQWGSMKQFKADATVRRDIDTSNENYVTPLLNKEDEIKSELTISENIGIDDNIHTVSAQVSLNYLLLV